MEFGKRQDPKRRAISLGLVVAIHLVFGWALVNGLARKAVELLPAPIETKLLEETIDEEEPPPPPPPKFDAPPPPYIPPPEISIQSTAPRPNAITTSPRPAPAAPPKPKVVSKPPVVKARNCREPDYPAVSERLGETGTVLLALLVGTDGRVSESKIEKSSGYPRLDKAAQDALSRCRFTPGEVNGQPAPAWANLKYTFRRER